VEDEGIVSGRSGGVGEYQASYLIQPDSRHLNGLVTTEFRLKKWADAGAGLICRATKYWTFLAAYVAPSAKERDATRLRISVMKENRLFPVAVSREPFALNDDFSQISLEFFSGHIRAEIRTPSGTYDLVCLAPQLPFAGSVGLIRFYDSIVNVKNFSVIDTKESYSKAVSKEVQRGFDTFICHSSNDKRIVENLVSKLRARDVTAWVDHEQIKLGDRVTEKINEGLSNSRSILVVLSKSLGQGRWVAPEYGAFINAALAGGRIRRVFPLQIEDVTPDEVPPLLVDLRRARYSSQTEFEELVREIKDQAA
jgi:hypothetical protein